MEHRPRLRLSVPEAPDEVTRRLVEALALPECTLEGTTRGTHLHIRLPEPDRHFWSPCLDLEVRRGESGSELSGVLGPHPEVWTLFVFLWAAMVMAWGMGLLFGFGQWAVGEPPTALWATLAASLGLASSCSVNILGRRSCRPQTDRLATFVCQTLGTEECLPPTNL